MEYMYLDLGLDWKKRRPKITLLQIERQNNLLVRRKIYRRGGRSILNSVTAPTDTGGLEWMTDRHSFSFNSELSESENSGRAAGDHCHRT